MTLSADPNVGVLIYTYNRVDDARVNMEIVRNVWKKSAFLGDVTIVHAFNGDREWWPEKYLEDELLRLDNPGHLAGAETLMNEGVKAFQVSHPTVDYVVVLAADTWLVHPGYVEKVVTAMRQEHKYLATCAWGTGSETDMFKTGMAIDLFVIDLSWATANRLFPLRYVEFVEKYADLFFYQDKNIYPERVLALRFQEALFRSVLLPSDNLRKKVASEHIYRMKEREPVHVFVKKMFSRGRQERRMYWHDMGLITHHDPVEKQRACTRWNLSLGEHGRRFLVSRDLSYFNRGVTKTSYAAGGRRISYGD